MEAYQWALLGAPQHPGLLALFWKQSCRVPIDSLDPDKCLKMALIRNLNKLTIKRSVLNTTQQNAIKFLTLTFFPFQHY